MNDYYFQLPQLELPFTPEELLDEDDIRIIESRYSEVTVEPVKQLLHTTNCAWGTTDSVSNSVSTTDTVSKSTHVANTGYVYSKKYQRLLWEYMNDTFHPDFVRPVISIGHTGRKIINVSLLCTKITTPGDVQDWHTETPRSVFPDILNRWRNELYVNFRVYGESAKDTTKVQFATISDELVTHIEQTYTQLFKNTPNDASSIPQEFFNKSFEGLMFRSTDDHMARGGVWDDHFTVAEELSGYESPFCINTAGWHRLFNANSSRCTLRISGNPAYSFEYYKNLHLDGKFIK